MAKYVRYLGAFGGRLINVNDTQYTRSSLVVKKIVNHVLNDAVHMMHQVWLRH